MQLIPGIGNKNSFLQAFVGAVEDIHDPLQLGRVRVRVFGLHGGDTDQGAIPTEDLPWALVLTSSSNACLNGVGTSPVGISQGAYVIVAFFDELYQSPLILGVIPGSIGAIKGSRDGVTVVRDGTYYEDPDGVFPSHHGLDNPVGSQTIGGLRAGEPTGACRGTSQVTGIPCGVPPEVSTHGVTTHGNNADGKRLTPQGDVLHTVPTDNLNPAAGRGPLEQDAERFSPPIIPPGMNSGFMTYGPYLQYLNRIEAGYGLPRGWLATIMEIESHGNRLAGSSKGAVGLFQFTRATAIDYNLSNRTDPITSALASARYFAKLLKKYNGNVSYALAGYNAGPTAISTILKNGGGVSGFPKESRDYIVKFESLFPKYSGAAMAGIWDLFPSVEGVLSVGEKFSVAAVKSGVDALKETPLKGGDDAPVVDIYERQKWSEPRHTMNLSRYPYCKTTATSSGHLIQIDDTEGNERLLNYHRKGTYQEMMADGSMVTKVVGNGYEVVIGDKNVYVNGECNVTIAGNATMLVQGHLTQEVKGDYRLNVHGDYLCKVGGNKRYDVIGEHTGNILGVSRTKYHTGREDAVNGNDLRVVSGENRTLANNITSQTVNGDWTLTVKGDCKMYYTKSLSHFVAGDYLLEVGGDSKFQTTGDHMQLVKGDSQINVIGDYSSFILNGDVTISLLGGNMLQETLTGYFSVLSSSDYEVTVTGGDTTISNTTGATTLESTAGITAIKGTFVDLN